MTRITTKDVKNCDHCACYENFEDITRDHRYHNDGYMVDPYVCCFCQSFNENLHRDNVSSGIFK